MIAVKITIFISALWNCMTQIQTDTTESELSLEQERPKNSECKINALYCIDQSFFVCDGEVTCGVKYYDELDFFINFEDSLRKFYGENFNRFAAYEYNKIRVNSLDFDDIFSTQCKCSGITPSICLKAANDMKGEGNDVVVMFIAGNVNELENPVDLDKDVILASLEYEREPQGGLLDAQERLEYVAQFLPNSRVTTLVGTSSEDLAADAVFYVKSICGDNKCPEIESGEWGQVDTGDKTIGTVLTYNCSEGFKEPSIPARCVNNKGSIGWFPKSKTKCKNEAMCPQLENGEWGEADLGDRKIGAEIKFSCADEFEPPETPAQCVDRGDDLEWFPSSGTECVAVEKAPLCPELEDGDWGTVDYGDRTEGTIAKLRCSEGYELPSYSALCISTGEVVQWIPTSGTKCVASEIDQLCPELSGGDWGSVDYGDRTEGTIVSLTCSEGYEPPGFVTICAKVGETVQWIPPEGTACVASAKELYCPELENGEWGTIDTGNRTEGTIAKLSCSEGFETPGYSALCLKTGDVVQWIPKSGTKCVESEKDQLCPELVGGVWGSIDAGARTVGEFVKLDCAEGFVEPKHKAVCIKIGAVLRWFPMSGTKCDVDKKLHLCPVLENGDWGTVDCGKLTKGTVVVLNCSEGYVQPENPAMCIKAEKTLNWFPSSGTKCEPETTSDALCPTLESGVWGSVDFGKRTIGTELQFDCSKGFEPPSQAALCIQVAEEPQWFPLSGTKCQTTERKQLCPELENGPWGTVDDGSRKVGTLLSLNCSEGYEPPIYVSVCAKTDSGNNWYPVFGTECVASDKEEALCPILESGDWGTVDCGDQTEGTILTLYCAPGFAPPDTVAHCAESNGVLSWFPESGVRCEAIEPESLCPPLLSGVWGTVNSGNNTQGTFLDLQCADGFEEPPFVAVCVESNGEMMWYPQEGVKCVESAKDLCPVLESGEWGDVDYGDRTEGTVLQLFCECGFEMPEYVAKCVEHESTLIWYPSFGTQCSTVEKEKLCPVVESGDWGTVDYGNRTEGVVLEFFCACGYAPPSEAVVCVKSSNNCALEWSPGSEIQCVPSTCEEKLCPVVESGDWGTVDVGSRQQGEVLRFECSENFIPPTVPAVCADDGESFVWFPESGMQCITPCPEIEEGDWGQADYGNRSEGAVLILNCNPNYSPPSISAVCSDINGNLVWFPPTAVECVKICPVVLSGEWGVADYGNRSEGTVLNLTCNPNFYPLPVAAVCVNNGTDLVWSPSNSTYCFELCPKVENGAWGSVNGDNREEGAVLSLICNNGYSPPAIPAVCTKSGTDLEWFPPSGMACEMNLCPELLPGPWGAVVTGDRKIGSTLEFECSPGFQPPEAPAVCVAETNNIFWNPQSGTQCHTKRCIDNNWWAMLLFGNDCPCQKEASENANASKLRTAIDKRTASSTLESEPVQRATRDIDFDHDDSDLTTVIWILAVICVLLIIAVVLLVIVCVIIKKKKSKDRDRERDRERDKKVDKHAPENNETLLLD